ncbi:hypothetical protein HHK36_026488 [Tetracentron sinense]|uniref:Desiccation-related protein PCC13-62 n=1 Tax=Tetracentron sinense TaxID=13715 RepID=A0A835D4N4_TETSI|nr:hypothetical protein HHK36_026488 [Tetracentron sinense]
MATLSFFFFLLLSAELFSLSVSKATKPTCSPPLQPSSAIPIHPKDTDQIQFALNLEHLETELFLYGALGRGLDSVDPQLAQGGPPPIGAQKANLDDRTRRIIEEFGYQEVGHLRAIKSTVGGFPRPPLDLRSEHFAKLFDKAFGFKLDPPFDPYVSTVNFLLASYAVPYVGLVAYVGTAPNLNGYVSKGLIASLLAVESGQDAVIRTLLYQKADEYLKPYNYTVAEFTNRISDLRNRLGNCGIKDEGVIVPQKLGAEKKTTSNILSADANSRAYARIPAEILRIVYGTGSEYKPGGFLPNGGDGKVARDFLKLK